MSLFKVFVGELVLITFRNMSITETSVVGNETYTVSVPFSKKGYLLEEDKYNYFFGSTPNFVTFSTKKRDVMLEIYDTIEQLPDTTLLDNLAIPTNKKDIN